MSSDDHCESKSQKERATRSLASRQPHPATSPYSTAAVVTSGGRQKPRCQVCKNHGVSVLRKGHKASCPYRHCLCVTCRPIIRRRMIRAQQKAACIRRQLQEQLQEERRRQKTLMMLKRCKMMTHDNDTDELPPTGALEKLVPNITGRTSYDDVNAMARDLQQYIIRKDATAAEQLVSHLSVEQRAAVARQKPSGGLTLLCLAVMRYSKNFVWMLLNDWYADVDQRCDVRFERNVTPLYRCCSAVRCRDMGIARMLVHYGADVNAAPDDRCTPVHAACNRNNLKLVRYLVQHGADVRLADIYGETCLMRAVFFGARMMATCLVKQGHASVNAVDNLGDPALHYAVRSMYRNAAHNLRVVPLLLRLGADPTIHNQFGDDALQMAALRGCPEIFDYLLARLQPSPQRQADLYALRAAQNVDFCGDFATAVDLWRKSVSIRARLPRSKVVTAGPDSLYNGAAEVRDVESLEAIADDRDALYVQALICRERILGSSHYETIHWLSMRALHYARRSDTYRRGIQLYKHALGSSMTSAHPIMRSEPHEKFCQILWHSYRKAASSVRFSDVTDLLRMMVLMCMSDQTASRDTPYIKGIALQLSIHLVHLLCRLTSSEAESQSLKLLASALVSTMCQTMSRRSVLHLAVDRESSSIHSEFYSDMPSVAVVQLLLEAGADVNAVDSAGSTPLQVAVRNQPTSPSSRRESWLRMIDLLRRHGATDDVPKTVDRRPSTSVYVAPSGQDEMHYVTLQGLAARAIRKYGIKFGNILPTSLAAFV